MKTNNKPFITIGELLKYFSTVYITQKSNRLNYSTKVMGKITISYIDLLKSFNTQLTHSHLKPPSKSFLATIPELPHLKIRVNKEGQIVFHMQTLTEGVNTLQNIGYALALAGKQNIVLESVEEPWVTLELCKHFTDMGEIIFKQRVATGMDKSNKKLGRPSPTEAIRLAVGLYQSGNYTGQQIADMTGVSRSTIYRHMGTFTNEDEEGEDNE